jgi:hypothetical protein
MDQLAKSEWRAFVAQAVLAFSVLVNVLLGVALYQTASDYESLRVWACEQGNGGHECGED